PADSAFRTAPPRGDLMLGRSSKAGPHGSTDHRARRRRAYLRSCSMGNVMRRRGSPLLRPTRLTWCGRNSGSWLPRNATASTTAGAPAGGGPPEVGGRVAEKPRAAARGGGAGGGGRPVEGGELDGAQGGARHVLAGHGDERPDLEAVGPREGGEHRRQALVHLAGAQLRDCGGRRLDARV